MTDAETTQPRTGIAALDGRGGLVALVLAFVAVHLWLGYVNLVGPGFPLGDVQIVYPQWVREGLGGAGWRGLDRDGVYPVLALLPMLLAGVGGAAAYPYSWLVLVVLLDCAALAVLLSPAGGSRRRVAAWWWIAFLVALGPIALGRIDSITVPVTLAGLVLLATRPRAAVLLLTLGAWIKVWPAALVAAVLVVARHRRTTLAMAATATVAVVGVALILGGTGSLLSFITQQSGRGLQVEAPVSTIWMWAAAADPRDSPVYYDTDILTWQLHGEGPAIAARLMTPLLVIAAIGVLVLGAVALRRGARAEAILPPLALALVMALLVFNKVGSPQFVSWLAVPTVYGLVQTGRSAASFAVPAVLATATGLLTQLIYPFFYGQFLGLQPAMLTVFTIRNLLELALLAWAVVALVRLVRRPGPADPPTIGPAPSRLHAHRDTQGAPA